MNKNILIIMALILLTSAAVVGYLFTQNKQINPAQESGRYESEVKMDDIYVDKNEKVVKPEAEKASSNLDEIQIENQMNELNNLDTEEINIDELN